MKSHSLLRRLLWRMVAITFVTVVVISAILILTFKSQIDSLRDRSLQGQAQDIANYFTISNSTPELQLPSNLEAAYTRSNGGFLYAVMEDDGTLLFASKGQKEPLNRFDRGDLASQYYFNFLSADQGETFYGTSMPVSLDGRHFVIQVAQGPEHRDVLIDSVFEQLIAETGWIVVLFLLLLLSVTYSTVKRSLAPLTKVSIEAATIGPSAAHLRLSEGNVPLEIRPLVRAMNSALDRLELGIEVQRSFTADAAHELRTPLAVLKAHIETAVDRKTADSLGSDVSRMERIVEQLLRLAQIEGQDIDERDQADLHGIAQEVAMMMAPLAVRQGKMVEVVGHQDALIVIGNADLIGLAIRNLVENGLQHTPEGSGVEISLSPEGKVTVIDHGPGIANEQRELVFQRFWRGARNKGNNAGLGLSIVQRCVQRCGGDVIIESATDVGARVTIRFRRPVVSQEI